MKFLNSRDATQAIKNSVCLVDGVPKYISDVFIPVEGGDDFVTKGTIRVRDLGHKARLSDTLISGVDIKPFKPHLGWMPINFSREMPTPESEFCVHISKKPMRQYKYGLCTGNTEIYCPVNSFYDYFTKKFFDYPGFRDLAAGRLKSLADMKNMSYEGLGEGQKMFFLSSEFVLHAATYSVFVLYYNTDKVGEFNRRTNTIVLFPSYDYVKDILTRRGCDVEIEYGT